MSPSTTASAVAEPLGGGGGHRRDARPARRRGSAHRRTVSSTFIRRARLPPMILRTVLVGQPVELVDVAGRVGQALGVGVVGAEQHVVGADQLGQRAEVLLLERADVDVALERPRPGPRGSPAASSCRRRPGCLSSGSTQLLPFSIDRDLELREAGQRAVADQRRHRVLDRAPLRAACGTPRAGTAASRCRCPSTRWCSARSRCRTRAWPTRTSCSTTFSQNGSNSGQAERAGPAVARAPARADEHDLGAPLDAPTRAPRSPSRRSAG